MATRLHIQHVKSATANKAPSADTINFGEIAINYHSSSPAIYIKDSSSNIVKFVPTDITGVTISGSGNVLTGASMSNNVLTITKGNAITTAATSGSGFVTGYTISNGTLTLTKAPMPVDTALDTGSTNAVQNQAIANALAANERTVAAALNDLETNKLDATAFTDVHVTAPGYHYTPSATTSVGSSTAGSFIKTVGIDAKGHVVSATTGTALTSFTETDPTVPAWAKEANKPSYSLSELTSTAHTHSGSDITSGTVGASYLPTATTTAFGIVKVGSFLGVNNGVISAATGTSSSTVARGDHGHQLSAMTSSTASTHFTQDEKDKLSSVASGAEVNVQSDWNVTSTTSDAYIKNKPTIPTVNDSTITIKMNNGDVGSFTTNASSAKTIDLGTVITGHAAHAISVTNGNPGAVTTSLTFVESVASAGTATSGNPQISTTRKSINILSALNDNTASGSIADSKAIVDYVKAQVTSSVNYKGSTTGLPSSAEVGDLYIASSQFAIASDRTGDGVATTAETGDYIICRTSGTTNSKWDVIQKNLTGAVTTTAATLTSGNVVIGDGDQKVKVSSYTIGTSVPSGAVFTDWSGTTETLHYTPTTAGTTTSYTGFITAMTIDSKNHVVKVTTGTPATYSEISEANITAATGSTTGLISGRRAKAAVTAFESVSGVTTSGTGNVITGGTLSGKNITLEKGYAVTTVTTGGTGNAITGYTLNNGSLTLNRGDVMPTIDTELSTASTNAVQNKVITQTILDNEYVVSAALNDLDDRKLDITAQTVTSVTVNGSGNVVANAAFTNKVLTLTKGNLDVGLTGATTSGTGNVLTGVTTGNGTATFGKGYAVTTVTTAGTGDAITGYTLSNGTLTLNKGDVTPTIDTELSTSSTNCVQNRVITQTIIDNEEITAAALNDLNTNKLDASAQTIATVVIDGVGNALTGATFSGKTLTLSKGNMVVTDSATTQEGHYDPYGATGNTTTAGMTGSQTLNWGSSVSVPYVIFDNKGHEKSVGSSTIIMPANPNTDTATTETGHYTPSSTSTTIGDASGFIKTIALDSKKHVVGVTTGSTGVSDVIINGNGNVLSNALFSNSSLTITKGSAVTNVSSSGAGNGVVTGYTYNDGSLVLNKGVYGITGITTSGSGNVVTNAEVTNNTLSITKGNAVVGTGVMNIVALTETQYANLAVKDATTLYVVIPD